MASAMQSSGTAFVVASQKPAGALRGLVGAPAPRAPAPTGWEAFEQTVPLASAAAILGSLAVAFGRRRSRREALVARRAEEFYPKPPKRTGVTGAGPRGPSYVPWINLMRKANKEQRFWRQRQILKREGITQCNGGYKVWHENASTYNMYTGPDSHPDNPWFPAASPGYWANAPSKAKESAKEAVGGMGVLSSMPLAKHGLVGGRTPTMTSARGSGLRCRGLVIQHAHKKAASTTKNQGKKHNYQFWGIHPRGVAGNAVKAGDLLLRNSKKPWFAGENVAACKRNILRAEKDGIVQWRGTNRKEIFVVPWEYVRAKCQWATSNLLIPQKYEAWMGTNPEEPIGRMKYINKMREEWLETEEGKAHLKKKEEQRKKRREIRERFHAARKQSRGGQPSTSPESVPAGSASESEA